MISLFILIFSVTFFNHNFAMAMDPTACTTKLAGEVELKVDRLKIVLKNLRAIKNWPKNGKDTLELLAQEMMKVEKAHLPLSVVMQWRQETGTLEGRIALVEKAFSVYSYSDPKADYDETRFPKAFSSILKPPAMRYSRRHIFEGYDLISQLDHITIINQKTGAMQIQRIDPELRSRLSNPTDPLVLAILDDPEYFRRLPTRNDLVIFNSPTSVWDSFNLKN